MTTKLSFRSLGAILALTLTLFLATLPFAQPSEARGGLGNLVGEWRMTELEISSEGDFQSVPYSGHVIFTKSGTMSVQAMNPDPSAPDTAYTVNGYEAYYGTVDVDRRAGSFTLTVESALARDLIGQELTRGFDVAGRTLVLTPADPAEGWRVTYERVWQALTARAEEEAAAAATQRATTDAPGTPAPTDSQVITIVDSRFEQEQLTVSIGTTVTVEDHGEMAHTWTPPTAGFDSGTLNPGDSFSFTFARSPPMAGRTGYFPRRRLPAVAIRP
jgi:plastocyanin